MINDSVVREADLSEDEMEAVEAKQRAEPARRAERFRRGHDRISVAGRGGSRPARRPRPPAGWPAPRVRTGWCWQSRSADAISPRDFLVTPTRWSAYTCPSSSLPSVRDTATSPGTSDDEVIALLDRAREGFREPAAAATSADPPVRDEEVRVIAGPVLVAGHLTIPEHPVGVVVFAHGSGSSRHSPRNRYVAEVLNGAGLATPLFDLLTLDEERNRSYVCDIELLARWLVDVTGWLAGEPDTAVLPVGFFGASTGAGAALVAAADPRVRVGAVVSRGGRPDLAGASLTKVVAPTLPIVGGRDEVVLGLNRRAQAMMAGECELTVVPGATHLFEEPGTLEQVAVLARDWFIDHLSRVPAPANQ